MKTPRAQGAILLLFDVEADVVAEHDDWHTHEHMPERLAIPGFLRGSRWTRTTPGQRYCVVYEVADLAVLDSPAYRARLDDPTPWTAKMMPRYVGMRRTLCTSWRATATGWAAPASSSPSPRPKVGPPLAGGWSRTRSRGWRGRGPAAWHLLESSSKRR